MKFISVLLMGLDVRQYPPFTITIFNEAYDITGFGQPVSGADEAELYRHSLDFLDRFIEEAAERGLNLRHRLDAQSVVWALQDRRDEQVGQIESFESESLQEEDDAPPPAPTLADLADKLTLPVKFLEDIHILLDDKRQVIFQGPPGTGKTYVARELAKHLAGADDRVTLVQFHPSYSYEDFVQGYRPKLRTTSRSGMCCAMGRCAVLPKTRRKNRT